MDHRDLKAPKQVQNFADHFELEQCLESSRDSGHVEFYAARHIATGILTHVKKISKLHLKQKHNVYSMLQAQEYKMLLKVDHPNIKRVLFMLESEHYVYIVTEFSNGGSLKETMISNRGYTDEQVTFILY